MQHFFTFINKTTTNFVTLMVSVFHPKSIRKLFAECFAILVVLFICLFLLSSLYFSSIMRAQVYASMKDTMELYNEQIERGFTEALVYLSENCIQNTDVSSLNTTQSESERYLSAARIRKTLSVGNYSLSNIGGLFIYSEPSDIYIRQVNNSWDNTQNNTKCSDMIIRLLREHKSAGTLDQLNINNWFLLSEGSDYFLVRIIKNRNTYAGAWSNLKHISSAFGRFHDMGTTILYVDENGSCIGNDSFSQLALNPADSLEKPSVYRNGMHSYLTVSAKLAHCDYYILALIPNDCLLKELAPLNGLMLFILIWLLLFSFILICIMNHFFDAPPRLLNPVITAMRNGQFDSQIETDNQFLEIQKITLTFNEMIREIQHLRIHIYEEQIAKNELELQYMKTQIAPHFLINCLNTIFVLSQDTANSELMHRIISTLSEHLRYTLATRTSVALSEEIYYVENYLQLTQLRFMNTLTYCIELPPEVSDARIFPLMLLMFTENSIKNNVVMGEPFHITIKGSSYEENGQQRIRLSHIDSGNGFDEMSLERYNHITDYPDATKDGHGIGIYNTVTRLRLTMGTSARIHFSNEPGLGARVDLDFPYTSYQEETQETIRSQTTERQGTNHESFNR